MITPSQQFLNLKQNQQTSSIIPPTLLSKGGPMPFSLSGMTPARLITPVAYSPLSKNIPTTTNFAYKVGTPLGMLSKSKFATPYYANPIPPPLLEEAYFPGQLKVSPNSGFHQFKKPFG
jgi:hypothetical protein